MSLDLTPTPAPATPVAPRRRRPSRSRGAQLHRIGTAINNTLKDQDVHSRLIRFGYTTEALEAALANYTQVCHVVSMQNSLEGKYRGATIAFERAWESAWNAYREICAIARIAFADDPGARAALQIDGERARTYADKIHQAAHFYANARTSPALLAGLAPYGIAEAQLIEAQGLLDQAVAARQAQSSARGTAQQQRLVRDRAYKALNDWYNTFVRFARLGLTNEPEWLEKLDIPHRSR